jgi:nudix-type nucleoside diphosphatase (YffH/AdpP family)
MMSGRAVIARQSRLFDDFFKIDEFVVAHEQTGGAMSALQRRLVFERGDAMAVLLLNTDRNAVVLVEQFRLPALVARRRDDASATDGWLVETVAGMIDANETPEAAAVRETREETGYRIRKPELIGRFFSSPGGTSERVFLYFTEVGDADRAGQGGGIDDEDIKVLHVGLDVLFERLARGLIEDAKLLIAAYWLQNRLNSRR